MHQLCAKGGLWNCVFFCVCILSCLCHCLLYWTDIENTNIRSVGRCRIDQRSFDDIITLPLPPESVLPCNCAIAFIFKGGKGFKGKTNQ